MIWEMAADFNIFMENEAKYQLLEKDNKNGAPQDWGNTALLRRVI